MERFFQGYEVYLLVTFVLSIATGCLSILYLYYALTASPHEKELRGTKTMRGVWLFIKSMFVLSSVFSIVISGGSLFYDIRWPLSLELSANMLSTSCVFGAIATSYIRLQYDRERIRVLDRKRREIEDLIGELSRSSPSR